MKILKNKLEVVVMVSGVVCMTIGATALQLSETGSHLHPLKWYGAGMLFLSPLSVAVNRRFKSMPLGEAYFGGILGFVVGLLALYGGYVLKT